MATLKFAVFCCRATLMWRRRTTSNYPTLLILLLLWSETLFVQVDSSAFLQREHSIAFGCHRRPPWIYPSFGRVESWCHCEEQVLQPSPLSPSFTHYLPCSTGNTALKCAMEQDKADVIAYLLSIEAPEWRVLHLLQCVSIICWVLWHLSRVLQCSQFYFIIFSIA